MRELIIHELFLYPKRYGDAGAFLQECQTHCATEAACSTRN